MYVTLSHSPRTINICIKQGSAFILDAMSISLKQGQMKVKNL